MTRLFCTCLFLIAVTAVPAQHKLFLVKAGEVPEKAIPVEEIYFFSSFTNGTAILKNGSRSNQRFNYHCLLDELQFLSGGDTLAIAEPGLLHKVDIDSITYYYYKGYLRQLMKMDKYTLAVKERITMGDRRKEGAYGISSGTSAIDNYSNIYRDGRAFRLQTKEDVFFKKEYTFYLGDVYDHFILADKKGFYNFFSEKRRAIDNYIKVEKINFNNIDDVKKLFLFCTG
ncbi:MAG: hypothetical protein BGP13_03515 [Sphingobacteriales bacterium 40-81]|nr:MAG: hypothetical protein BGP13_03515 [Sphingobacteriales bacterium 40-81]